MVTIQQQGEEVDRQGDGNRLVIARGRTRLTELLAKCRSDNQPETVEFGAPVGRESI